MTTLLSTVYSKDGAEFQTGQEAFNNKNSMYPPLLSQQATDFTQLMLAQGILLQPVEFIWDRLIFTLTVERLVTNGAEYELLRDANVSTEQFDYYSSLAGWTLVSRTSRDI
jgi:hypothetical protein